MLEATKSMKKCLNYVFRKMFDFQIGRVAVDKVDKVEGEARGNNRKAKLIFFYEWEIKFTWKGCVNGKDKEVPYFLT